MDVGSFFYKRVSHHVHDLEYVEAYQVEVGHSILQLKRQNIICEGHKEQRPFAHTGLTKHARLFEQLV